jgi:hypothetical protein
MKTILLIQFIHLAREAIQYLHVILHTLGHLVK